MPKFDPNKPVQTRDGRPARILCTDRKGEGKKPIVALVDCYDESIYTFRSDGRYNTRESEQESAFDLVNIPERLQRVVVCSRRDDDKPSTWTYSLEDWQRLKNDGFWVGKKYTETHITVEVPQ